MDTVQGKLTEVEHSPDVVREKKQRSQERPIEMGSISRSTKGSVFGSKGDGGNGLQTF